MLTKVVDAEKENKTKKIQRRLAGKTAAAGGKPERKKSDVLKTLCKNFAAYLRWIFNIAPRTAPKKHRMEKREKDEQTVTHT